MKKKNILPNMQQMRMTDKDGTEFVMEVDLRQGDDTMYVFLSDTHQPGTSRLGRDAMYYIEKLIERLNLDSTKTIFYRHIYQEQMGSTFGRFKVDWQDESGPNYRFNVLTNIDDLQNVSRVIGTSLPISLAEQVAARKFAHL